MKRYWKRVLLSIVALALLGAAAGGGAWWWAESAYRAQGPLAQEASAVMPRGSGVKAIAGILAEKNIIAVPPLVFQYYVWRSRKTLKAGEYAFPAQASPEEVIGILHSGKTVIRKFSVAEGLSTREILERLNAAEGLEGEPAALDSLPDGAVLPETYHYSWGDARQGILDRMRLGMQRALLELWQQRAENLPLASPHQALTLASIIERETGKPEERPQVAAVFINRLRLGMRLQSDPTAVYGITRGAPLGREVTAEDIRTPSAYNTYTIDGLPPGPICNPGRAALAAALNPPSSRDLYFVADGAGGHRFAASLAEHNRNVAKLRAAR